MSKSVKNIAKVAAFAAAAYYGGQYLQGFAGKGGSFGLEFAKGAANSTPIPGASGLEMFAGGGASTATAASTAAGSGIAGGITSSLSSLKDIVSVGGVATQGLGLVQQQLAKNEAADAEKERQRIEAKAAEAEAQKARIQNIRQQRVLQGRAEASAAGRGFSPQNMPSSVVTGTGALGTQTAVANTETRGRVELARDLANAGTDIFTATNEAAGWGALAGFGESAWKNASTMSSAANSFKTIFG